MDMSLDMIGNSQNQENPRCTTNLGYIFVYNKLEENTHYWNFEYEALIKSAFFRYKQLERVVYTNIHIHWVTEVFEYLPMWVGVEETNWAMHYCTFHQYNILYTSAEKEKYFEPRMCHVACILFQVGLVFNAWEAFCEKRKQMWLIYIISPILFQILNFIKSFERPYPDSIFQQLQPIKSLK